MRRIMPKIYIFGQSSSTRSLRKFPDKILSDNNMTRVSTKKFKQKSLSFLETRSVNYENSLTLGLFFETKVHKKYTVLIFLAFINHP